MISKLLLLIKLVDVTAFRKYQVNNIIQPQDKFTQVNSFSAAKAKLNFGESMKVHKIVLTFKSYQYEVKHYYSLSRKLSSV